MVAFNPLKRQPDTLDFANASQFRFQLLKIPNTVYFTTSVNLPGIAFSGDAIMNSRFKAMPFMGDTLDFSPMELTFNVSESLSNYREIHDWMTGIGFPKETDQFASAINAEKDLKPGSAPPTSRRVGASTVNPSNLVSDGTLTILSNKNNPVLNVNFKSLYPTSLSGLQFNTQGTDTEQLTATVTMNYDLYEFEVL
jgi:hypothetical protein